MSYSVYIHTNKINGKRYIGVTRHRPERRWNSGKGYKAHPYFYSAIQKYGWDNFDHFIVEVDSPELMYQLEKQYIEYYKTTDRRYGYNLSLGGEQGNYQGKNSHTPEYFKNTNVRERLKAWHREYYKKIREKEIKRVEQYRKKKKMLKFEDKPITPLW